MACATALYSSLQGQRVRESEMVTERERGGGRGGEREKTSKSRRDYATMIRELHDVGKPIETKYFKFDC
jgi:hypothetical protein